jgi:predicted PurR-regulated permease PerM
MRDDAIAPIDVRVSPRIETASQVIAALALIFVLQIKILSALLAGLLVYQLVHYVVPLTRRFGMTLTAGKATALTLIAVVIGVPIALGIVELSAMIGRGIGDVAALMQRMAEVIGTARSQVPEWALAYLPSNIDDFQADAARWLTEHAGQIGGIGQDVGRVLFHLILGMIVGGIIAFQGAPSGPDQGPLARAFMARADTLAAAFRNVVFSQVLISALNTTLTAMYLGVLLPLLGIHLPLVKTMIAVTFLVGLMPVIGNLISNTVIVVVSLSASPYVAAGSLAYLVVIHKLEYFFNARIIGSQIQARAWELLIVLLVMEAVFGIPGVIAGPIFYAYLKSELMARKLI